MNIIRLFINRPVTTMMMVLVFVVLGAFCVDFAAVHLGRREAVAFRYIRSDTIYIGLTHPHYDQFGLEPGQRFVDNDAFPHLDADGEIQR